MGDARPATHPIEQVQFCDCETGQSFQRLMERKQAEHAAFIDATLQLQQQALERRFNATIPAKYHGLTIEGLSALNDGDKARTIAAATLYRDTGTLTKGGRTWHSIVLEGPCGTGKTTVAYDIAKARVNAGRSVLATTWANLYARIKSTYGGDGDAERIVMDAQRADVLVLDDLGQLVGDGVAQAGPDQLDKLKQIIDWRFGNNLQTVITTNLSRDQLRRVYGEPIAGRIIEDCAWLTMGGQDLRMR